MFDAIQGRNHCLQSGTLAPQRLRLLRGVPDCRIFQFATYLGQALAFEIVLKETP